MKRARDLCANVASTPNSPNIDVFACEIRLKVSVKTPVWHTCILGYCRQRSKLEKARWQCAKVTQLWVPLELWTVGILHQNNNCDVIEPSVRMYANIEKGRAEIGAAGALSKLFVDH